MPLIAPNNVCNVLVTTEVDADIRDEYIALSTETFDLFKSFKGFISGAIMKSEESNQVITVLQWETKADHLACKDSPRWMTEGKPRFFELMESGKIRLSPEVYSVVHAAKK